MNLNFKINYYNVKLYIYKYYNTNKIKENITKVEIKNIILIM